MRITEIRTSNHLGLPEGESLKAKYLEDVEAWGKEGLQGEDKAAAVSRIQSFINDPEETDLSFFNMGLTTVPPLGFMAERIKSLALSNNRLQDLPEWLGELPNLEELYLGWNRLQDLPEWLGELPNLGILSVSYNSNLKKIPFPLLDSSKFTSLSSEETKITKTLEELKEERQEDRAAIEFNLLAGKIAPRLPESSVSKVNHFIKEPSRYLEKLEAWGKEGVAGENRKEPVSNIKAFIKDPEKTELSFNGCRLTTLPPLYFIAERITDLALNYSRLSFSELHKSLEALPIYFIAEITDLALNYNRLSFSELHKSLEALPRLKKLYLHGNMVDSLPDFFGQFPDLEVLQLPKPPGSYDLKEEPLNL